MAIAIEREGVVRLRVSVKERARMEALSAHYNLNLSALIRFLVKQEHDFVSADGAGRRRR